MAGRDATICAVLGAGQSGYVGSIDEDVYAELDSSSTGAQMAVLYASRYLANLAAAQTQSDRTRSLNFNQLFSTLTSASQPLEPLVELLTCRTLADAAAQMPVHCALRQLTDLCECSMSTLGQAGCGLPAACTLAISIFRSSSPAAIVADFAASLQPHCLKLLPTVPRAVSAQLVSELLPLALATITSAACPMFQVRLRTAFLELLAADKEAIRETGLTLGVRFPDELFVTPDTLCNTKEVWLLLRRCLCATSEFCRRRALFILLSAVGCTTTEVSRSSPPPTNRKKCKREKRPTEPKSGWAAFAWAYVAVETGTEAVSPNWTKVVETLGQTGTLSVPGGAVDVVPWAQLLLELGIRHCHPNVRRGALDASLTGLAFGGVHTLLVDGDLFVISCCDIMSENSVAADLFSEIRANTEASKTRSTVHAFLNRQVSASKLFLRQWVEWLICRFNAPPGSRPCSNALLHVYLHWLATIQAESLVPAGCGLTEQNLRGLAGLVKNIDATPSSSQVCVNGVQAFAVRSVVSAATRLTEPNSSIFRRLAPILLLAGPHEFEAQHSGTEWLERLSAGHAAGDLQLTVSSFLCPGQFSLDSISEGLCAEELARAAANMICILAGGETTGQRAAVSTIRMALHILERAHTHLYQPLAQLNRAVLLVDAVMTAIDSAHSEAPTSATACDTLRIYLCEWLQNEGAASAASAAIGTVLAKWAGTDFQDHDSNQNRQLQIAGEPGGKGTVVTNGTAGACFSLLAHLQKFPRGRVEPVVATLLTQLLHQCDLLSTTQSMIGLGRLELALGHLRGPCLGRLKVSTGHLCDAAIGSLLAGIDVASAMGAHLRWRCIHCLASSRCAAFGPGGAVPRELVMTLLSQASAALELATDTVKIQTIVATVGDVFTLLVDVEKLDPVPDDVNNALTTCQHKLLNACGRASASLPTDFRHLQSDLQRFTMVHTLLRPTLFGQSSIHRSVEKCLRFTLRELYTMSIENSNWAPVMALHCTRMWLRHPTSALICVPEIAKLCCYTSLRKTGVAGLQPDTKLAVHQTENELLVRATMLFFLRAVIRNTGHEQLVKRLVLTMLELVKEYYHKTPQHDLTVVHKVRISLGQSLCVLASNIQAGAPVAKTIHCVVAEKMLREYLPSERQYLDLLSLQLFRKCPALAAQWLPTVVTNCALRPQIMQGVLLVTGKWLLHLDSHCHMQYFKPLFRALVTWLHSGHRGLRSLVQVLAQRLLDDCYSRAASARQQGDIVAVAYYTALDCDEQLHCIYDCTATVLILLFNACH